MTDFPVPEGRPAETFEEAEDALLSRWPETRLEPSLDRIEAFTELLGRPQDAYPVIHLTGTNGKTSTSRMIDTLLRTLNLRTGRFTSPHVEKMSERISIDGEPLEALIRAHAPSAPERPPASWADVPATVPETVALARRARADRPPPEVLTITFVRVRGDEVSGELAPYRDPLCGCALFTRFFGQLKGDVIEGTYLTRHGDQRQDQKGRWSAKRARAVCSREVTTMMRDQCLAANCFRSSKLSPAVLSSLAPTTSMAAAGTPICTNVST